MSCILQSHESDCYKNDAPNDASPPERLNPKSIPRRRGRPPTVDADKLREIARNEAAVVVLNGKILPRSNAVWAELILKYKVTMSLKGFHNAFHECRYGIGDILGLKKNHVYRPPCIEELSEESSTSQENEEVDANHYRDFFISIPAEKWAFIAPTTVHEKSRDMDRLRRGVWTDVIADMIIEKKRIYCCWSFKNHQVAKTNNAKKYLVFSARCVDCGAWLEGSVDEKPHDGTNVIVNITIKEGDLSMKHTTRRQLKSVKRTEKVNQMIVRKEAPSKTRNDDASNLMRHGELEPPNLPRLGVYSKALSERITGQRLHKDPMIAVHRLQYLQPIGLMIHEVGFEFVHFWTAEQQTVFNACHSKGHSKLSIDASGKFVHKLPRPGGTLSGHFFLYIMVINIPGKGKSQIPVAQMLSARHNAVAIQYWMMEFIRLGAAVPKEVVTDDSGALVSAVCRAFAKMPDTESYINKCFQFLQGEISQSDMPACYVRLDVAHILKAVGGWKELDKNRTPRLVRRFYLKGVGLLVDTCTIEAAAEIMKAILTVALSEREGVSVLTGENTPSDEKKMFLKNTYRTAGLPETFNAIEEILGTTDPYQSEYDASIREETRPISPLLIDDANVEDMAATGKAWVKDIESASRDLVQQSADGDRDNMMFLPRVVKPLLHLFSRFPLWSKVMNDYFRVDSRPSSAGVESTYNDLKTRKLQLPMRIDNFLIEYYKYIDGAVKLAGATDFVQETDKIINSNDGQPPNINLLEEIVSLPSASKNISSYSPNNENTSEYAFCSQTSNLLTCSLCLEGNLPGGAHVCVNCKKAIHNLDFCSVPVNTNGEDEGYGQRRRCIQCNAKLISAPNVSSSSTAREKTFEKLLTESNPSAPYLIDRLDNVVLSPKHQAIIKESRETEHWKGLGGSPKTKRKARYLGPCPEWATIEESNVRNAPKVGFLRNGGLISAKPKRSSGKIMQLKNTCAFDSIVQVLACIYVDSLKVRDCFESMENPCEVLRLAQYLAQTSRAGLQATNMRSSILTQAFPGKELVGGVISHDCVTTAAHMYTVTNCPESFTEHIHCPSPYCPEPNINKKYHIVRIDPEGLGELGLKNLQDAIQQIVPGQICSKKLLTEVPQNWYNSDVYTDPETKEDKVNYYCSGVIERTYTPSSLLFMEILSTNENKRSPNAQFQDVGTEELIRCLLSSIPPVISFHKSTYRLRGVINYKAPIIASDDGHYIGYSLRCDGTWEVFDDLKTKVSRASGDTSVSPHSLIYSW
ncbi:uncharacterized protein LOC116180164 [Photinus pyralis]|nr:uncharacterized protein LOC116180164 [Photinus pyralis]